MKLTIANLATVMSVLVGHRGAHAESPVGRYTFSGTFNNMQDELGECQPLQHIGTQNRFVLDLVPGHVGQRTVVEFPEGGGVELLPVTGADPPGICIPSDSYTLVVVFRLDDVSGWKRVLDFKAGGSDTGLYILGGRVRFHGSEGTGRQTIGARTYVRLTISRDGATKRVACYVGAEEQFSFTDTRDLAVLQQSTLRFFKDDRVIPGEESPGAVAEIILDDEPLLPFLRGDTDGDRAFSVTDAVKCLNHLFLGEPIGCQDAADVNDDGQLNVTDPVALLNWLFLGGAPPAGPGTCVGDGTLDSLDCEASC